MTTLSVSDRDEIFADFMRGESNSLDKLNLVQNDLRVSVDASDDWFEIAQADFNQAIPMPARGELNAKQKWRLFMLNAQKRFERAGA